MEDILRALRAFRDERDWAKFHRPKDLAISVSVEAAELLEVFQWQNENQPLSEGDRRAVADEAADVLLYTLMIFDRLGLDPTAEAFRKIDQNSKKYPVATAYGRAGRSARSG